MADEATTSWEEERWGTCPAGIDDGMNQPSVIDIAVSMAIIIILIIVILCLSMPCMHCTQQSSDESDDGLSRFRRPTMLALPIDVPICRIIVGTSARTWTGPWTRIDRVSAERERKVMISDRFRGTACMRIDDFLVHRQSAHRTFRQPAGAPEDPAAAYLNGS